MFKLRSAYTLVTFYHMFMLLSVESSCAVLACHVLQQLSASPYFGKVPRTW
jgi:hypothetical protein